MRRRWRDRSKRSWKAKSGPESNAVARSTSSSPLSPLRFLRTAPEIALKSCLRISVVDAAFVAAVDVAAVAWQFVLAFATWSVLDALSTPKRVLA